MGIGPTVGSLVGGPVGAIIGIGIELVIGIGLGFATGALGGDQETPEPNLGFRNDLGLRIDSVTSSAEPRRLVVGRVRTGGLVSFRELTQNNQNLQQVFTLAAHTCSGIDGVFLNQDVVYPEQLDSDGWVTSGKYANKARFQWELGTSEDQPFPDLVIEASSWSEDHRQIGHTKIWVELVYDANLFPAAPNVSVTIRGAVVDEVDGTMPEVVTATRWTQNFAWNLRWYMTLARTAGGFGAEGLVHAGHALTAANVSDEIVGTAHVDTTVLSIDLSTDTITLQDRITSLQDGDRVKVIGVEPPGGLSFDLDYFVIVVRPTDNDKLRPGIQLAASLDDAWDRTPVDITSAGVSVVIRRTGEPRYTMCGVMKLDRTPYEILLDMVTAAVAPIPPFSQGFYNIIAPHYIAPTVSLNEDDEVGRVDLVTERPPQDAFNAVQGTFASPLDLDEVTDYPPVTNTTFEAQDGERIYKTLDLPFTIRASTCQRLANIVLQRNRLSWVFNTRVNLKGLSILPAIDVISYTRPQYGWEDEEFSVFTWKFGIQDQQASGPVATVGLVLQRTGFQIYYWDPFVSEQPYFPKPRDPLYDPNNVPAPTSLSMVTVSDQVGDPPTVIYSIDVRFEVHDGFVIDGGNVLGWYKLASSSEWVAVPPVGGSDRMIRFSPVSWGLDYDIRLQSVTRLGATSEFSHYIYTVGTAPAGFTAVHDYGIRSTPITNVIDYGFRSTPITVVHDYGFYTGQSMPQGGLVLDLSSPDENTLVLVGNKVENWIDNAAGRVFVGDPATTAPVYSDANQIDGKTIVQYIQPDILQLIGDGLGLTGNAACTVFAVVELINIPATQRTILQISSSVAGRTMIFSFGTVGWAVWYLDGNATFNVPVAGVPYIVAFRRDTGYRYNEVECFEGGVQQTLSGSGNPTGLVDLQDDETNLGARGDGAGYSDQKQGRIVVYDRHLSNAEMNQVGRVLHQQFPSAPWTDLP